MREDASLYADRLLKAPGAETPLALAHQAMPPSSPLGHRHSPGHSHSHKLTRRSHSHIHIHTHCHNNHSHSPSHRQSHSHGHGHGEGSQAGQNSQGMSLRSLSEGLTAVAEARAPQQSQIQRPGDSFSDSQVSRIALASAIVSSESVPYPPHLHPSPPLHIPLLHPAPLNPSPLYPPPGQPSPLRATLVQASLGHITSPERSTGWQAYPYAVHPRSFSTGERTEGLRNGHVAAPQQVSLELLEGDDRGELLGQGGTEHGTS